MSELAAAGAAGPRLQRPPRPAGGADEAVLIVDFKLGAAPARPARAHVAQLALYRAALRPLYPSLPVSAALVYLDGPTVRANRSGRGLEALELLERRSLNDEAAREVRLFCQIGAGNGLAALMRSHLLARFARDGERKRQGGRPRFCLLVWESLGGSREAGPSGSAAALGVAMLLAGGTLAAESEEAAGGMVPYDHPVFKNGVRVLWHGAWRGSQGRVVRQYARATALARAATGAIQAPQTPVPKEFSVLADPGDARASRMAKDFATVMTKQVAPGRAMVGPTSPDGLGKVIKDRHGRLGHCLADSLVSSAKGDPEWIRRVPYVARVRRDARSDRAEGNKIYQWLAGEGWSVSAS